MIAGGIVHVPGDKSISHRALILAALADGTSHLRDLLISADIESTARVLRGLGAEIPALGSSMEITGRGRRGLRAPSVDLDCGNSGTTARLMAGVVAGHPFAARFTGDASLSERPMQRVARPLDAMGARVVLERGDGLPMTVHGGALRALKWETETASAQAKSAVLLAGLVAGVPVVVREPARSRDHTERLLRSLGVDVDVVGDAVRLEPVARLAPLDLRIPGDPSSAAFMAALAVLASGGALTVPEVCLNPTRTGFYRALQRMGARVELHAETQRGGDEVGAVFAWASSLHAAEFGAEDVPAMIDELPLLACVAARAAGTTTLSGAAELRVKESDRVAAVVANLRAVGVTATERPDGLTVTGTSAPLRGSVTTRGDHRVAMAFGVLGALSGNAITIDDPACVSVSYPTFWDDLRAAVAG